MKVKYASQIFSATVAASMQSCVQGCILPFAAEMTITLQKRNLGLKISIDLLKTQHIKEH